MAGGRKEDRGRETRSRLAIGRSIDRAPAGFTVATRRGEDGEAIWSFNLRSRTRSKAAKEGREAREFENAKRLDKLPPEVWEKIIGNLDENDLFPLALSCRYFREKQKELVARTRQHGRESDEVRLALRTTLHMEPEEDQPASADYLRFCSKEKLSGDDGVKKANSIEGLAAYHGHLPLLQELVNPSDLPDEYITMTAGEFSFSQSRLLLVLVSDMFLAFSSSQRAEANLRPCSG